jgi:heme A synthase
VWTKEERRWLRWFSVIAVVGIAVQAVLGGEVVIKLLHYWLPVIHACFAQIVFAALLSIAVFTSRWWISDQPQLEGTGSPSIHSLAIANAVVIYLQVILGAGFRHKEIPVWPHMVGALIVLGMVIWLAAVLRRRFEKSAAISKTRILLHAILGTQLLLGLGAYWSRLTTADAPQPMPLMVTLTVLHTVVGAILFGVSILIVLLCYRLVPRKGNCLLPPSGRWPFNEHCAHHRINVVLSRQCFYHAHQARRFFPRSDHHRRRLLHGRAGPGELAAHAAYRVCHHADRGGNRHAESLH